MKNKTESRGSEHSRRGFFQRCLGAGAVLGAAPPGRAGASGVLGHLHRPGASALALLHKSQHFLLQEVAPKKRGQEGVAYTTCTVRAPRVMFT